MSFPSDLMFFFLATVTVDIESPIVIAVGSIVVSLLSFLAVRNIRGYEKRISEAHKDAKAAAEKAEELAAAAEKRAATLIAEAEKRAIALMSEVRVACDHCRDRDETEHKLLHARISEAAKERANDLKAMSKDVSDALITCAGFGSTYATREEVNRGLDTLRTEVEHLREEGARRSGGGIRP